MRDTGDTYRPGSWWRICDRCGWKRRAEDTAKEWTGLIVCRDTCLDVRNPQDFVRGVRDRQAVPNPRPEPPDRFLFSIPNHVLFVRFDGTNGATSATDESPSGHSLTFHGNAHIDTSQSVFGGASLLLDGSGDYVEIPVSSDFAFGAFEPFTIHARIRPAGFADLPEIISYHTGFGDRRSFIFRLSDAGGGTANISFGGAPDGINFTSATTTSAPIVVNTWQHVAATRDAAGVMRVFVDGVLVASAVEARAFYAANSPLLIGARLNLVPASAGHFNGHIDQIEIVKGVALWTEDFTPPPEPPPIRNVRPEDL